MADDTTTDPELERLLDIIEQGYYEAGRFVRKGRLGSDGFVRAIGAHATLLAHIAAQYVRRDAADDPPVVTPAVPSREVTVRIVGRERVVSAKYEEGPTDGR